VAAVSTGNANGKNTFIIISVNKQPPRKRHLTAKNSLTNSKIPRQFSDIPVKTEFPDFPESGNRVMQQHGSSRPQRTKETEAVGAHLKNERSWIGSKKDGQAGNGPR